MSRKRARPGTIAYVRSCCCVRDFARVLIRRSPPVSVPVGVSVGVNRMLEPVSDTPHLRSPRKGSTRVSIEMPLVAEGGRPPAQPLPVGHPTSTARRSRGGRAASSCPSRANSANIRSCVMGTEGTAPAPPLIQPRMWRDPRPLIFASP
jgi:hypothetical protein